MDKLKLIRNVIVMASYIMVGVSIASAAKGNFVSADYGVLSAIFFVLVSIYLKDNK